MAYLFIVVSYYEYNKTFGSDCFILSDQYLVAGTRCHASLYAPHDWTFQIVLDALHWVKSSRLFLNRTHDLFCYWPDRTCLKSISMYPYFLSVIISTLSLSFRLLFDALNGSVPRHRIAYMEFYCIPLKIETTVDLIHFYIDVVMYNWCYNVWVIFDYGFYEPCV